MSEFPCKVPNCDKGYSYRKGLVQHERNQHSDKELCSSYENGRQCKECSSFGRGVSGLATHLGMSNECPDKEAYYLKYLADSDSEKVCNLDGCDELCYFHSLGSGYKGLCSHSCSVKKRNRKYRDSDKTWPTQKEEVKKKLRSDDYWEDKNIQCKECGSWFKNIRGISTHLGCKNCNISKEFYYLKYIASSFKESVCDGKGCSNSCGFDSINKGFFECCSFECANGGRSFGSAEEKIKKEHLNRFIEPTNIDSLNSYRKMCNVISKEEGVFNKLYSNWSGSCYYCEVGLENNDNLKVEVEHKTSISFGFKNGLPPEYIADYDNLEVVCGKCNRSKGPKNEQEFIKYKEKVNDPMNDDDQTMDDMEPVQ